MIRMAGLAMALIASMVFSVMAQSLADPMRLIRPRLTEAHRVSSNNADLNSNDDSKHPFGGETVVLADLKGPGIVTHMWITIAGNEYGWPRLLRVRVYYDGSATPSVDVPIGDFFAVGHGVEKQVNSVMIRNGSSGRSRNSYWPMPFKKSCKITVTNEGTHRLSNLYYHVDWEKVPSLPDDVLYFHAWYKQELAHEKGKPYEILNIKGQGQYAGTVLNVIQNEVGWFGEGDEFFYVDGNPKPNIEGTGTEDYFNDAWSLRVAEGLYTGVPVAEGTGLGSRMTAYRWHIPDPVPFQKSLRFEIELAGWTFKPDGAVRSSFEQRTDLFSTTAFWYQKGIAQGLKPPPYGPARLPHGNAKQIEAEDLLSGIKVERGKAEVQKEVFWSRDLLFLKAEGEGSRFDIPFDVAEDGEYEIVAQIAHSNDYGIYRVFLDGTPMPPAESMEHEPGANLGGGPAIDAYYTEIYVTEDHTLGWKKLARGRHMLSFVCIGRNPQSLGYHLGLDTIILSRVASPQHEGGEQAERLRRLGEGGVVTGMSEVTAGLGSNDRWVRGAAAWALTQAAARGAQNLPIAALAAALRDPDPTVRGLAAVAIRDSGKAAAGAVPALQEALRDPVLETRMAAAHAVGSAGPAGAPAVPVLIEICKEPNAFVPMLRLAVESLGRIGKAAAPAIPVLEGIYDANPRVRSSIDLAIKQIKATQ